MRVEYMDHSGSDLLVCNAARASFGKESEWDISGYEEVVDEESRVVEYHPIKALKERDKKLIHFLAREKHVLPFRHPTITLRCQAPIFVARQLGKHQVGMSWSEESRRYVDDAPEFFWPDKWRKRADNVKQGSSDEPSEYMHDEKYGGGNWNTINEYVQDEVIGTVVKMYEDMIAKGVAPEQARMILPQNMMITWVWTGTLLSWHHMLQLRLAPDTQKETRDFAKMVQDILMPLFPVSMEALRNSYENTAD